MPMLKVMTIARCVDAEILDPVGGDVLAFDGADQKWKNVALAP